MKKKKDKEPKIDSWLNNEKIIQKMKDGFSFDYSIGECCFYAGISERAYYYAKKRHPEKVAGLESYSMTLSMHAKRKIGEQIMDEKAKGTGDAWEYLKTRNKDWMPKSRTELTGKDGAPVQYEEIPKDDFDAVKDAMSNERQNTHEKRNNRKAKDKPKSKARTGKPQSK